MLSTRTAHSIPPHLGSQEHHRPTTARVIATNRAHGLTGALRLRPASTRLFADNNKRPNEQRNPKSQSISRHLHPDLMPGQLHFLNACPLACLQTVFRLSSDCRCQPTQPGMEVGSPLVRPPLKTTQPPKTAGFKPSTPPPLHLRPHF